MTAEDIAALTGRELDAAIAVRVFGLRPCLHNPAFKRYNPQTGRCLECNGLAVTHYTADDFRGVPLVLDKLRADGWEVVNMCYYRSTKYWYVRLDDEKFRPVTSIGPTLPVALGRAALMTTLTASATQPNGGDVHVPDSNEPS